MNEQSGFSWKKRALSFKYASKGLKALFLYEHNARIHVMVAAMVLLAGVLLRISLGEWCLILLCIGAVLSAEAFNSAIEALADRISPEFDSLIGKAKDLAAAGVLILAITSVSVGLMIFLPKIIQLI